MRRQLVLVALATTSMVVLAFMVPLALLVANLAHDRAMANVERDAQSLARTLVAYQPQPVSVSQAEAILATERRLPGEVIVIVMPDGVVVGGLEVDTAVVSDAKLARSIAVREVEGGEAVAVPVLTPDDTITVVYGFASDALLRRNVTSAWFILGLLAIFSVGVAVFLADRLGSAMVVPVRALSQAAAHLGQGDLEMRVTPGGPPEIQETGHAFNLLAGRIVELISNEREAIADTSHRLRTPLTALQLDVDSVEAHDVRQRLQDDVAEMERTVDHVIRQARRPVREGAGMTSDLGEIVVDRAGFWEPLAEEQGRPWKVRVPEHPVLVAGHPDDISAAVDALITNVFAHTPEGSACTISVTPDGTFHVVDRGPGFDPALTARGRSSAGSTGLGLDIARQAAEAHGGEMTVERHESGGSSVALRFGNRA